MKSLALAGLAAVGVQHIGLRVANVSGERCPLLCQACIFAGT